MDLAEVPAEPFRRHPWEEARFRFAHDVLHRAGLDRSRTEILDVGAGDGWLAARLLERMPPGTQVVCWDSAYGRDVQRFGAGAPPGVRFVADRPEGAFD